MPGPRSTQLIEGICDLACISKQKDLRRAHVSSTTTLLPIISNLSVPWRGPASGHKGFGFGALCRVAIFTNMMPVCDLVKRLDILCNHVIRNENIYRLSTEKYFNSRLDIVVCLADL